MLPGFVNAAAGVVCEGRQFYFLFFFAFSINGGLAPPRPDPALPRWRSIMYTKSVQELISFSAPLLRMHALLHTPTF